MNFLLKFIVSALVVMILANFLPGVSVKNFMTAMIVVIVLGICNAIIKPILIFLTLPITLITLGLFLLVINVIMIYITDAFISGFAVNGFLSALIFSILLSLSTSVSHRLIDRNKEE